jgi:hypothetical protein
MDKKIRKELLLEMIQSAEKKIFMDGLEEKFIQRRRLQDPSGNIDSLLGMKQSEIKLMEARLEFFQEKLKDYEK